MSFFGCFILSSSTSPLPTYEGYPLSMEMPCIYCIQKYSHWKNCQIERFPLWIKYAEEQKLFGECVAFLQWTHFFSLYFLCFSLINNNTNSWKTRRLTVSYLSRFFTSTLSSRIHIILHRAYRQIALSSFYRGRRLPHGAIVFFFIFDSLLP